MPLDPKGQLNRLEAEVDSTTLAEVVARLATVAWLKAEHIRSNWQDEKLAKQWEADGKRLDAVVRKLSSATI